MSTQMGDKSAVSRARAVGYSEADIASVPPEVIMGMGCGNPVGVAGLREGETVLDLGCGGGFDCLLAADRVGPAGRIIGVDTSNEVLQIARAAAAKQGRTNVEFHMGTLEALPLPDTSIDVIISNCVISDVRDRGPAFREAVRVLRPGGRVMISDLVVTADLPDELSAIPEIWADWLTHAPNLDEYLTVMRESGLCDTSIVEERPYASPGTPPDLIGRITSVLVSGRR
jgi:arsenite methyltransferase